MGKSNEGDEDSNRVSQEYELTALKSIYGDDVQDLRVDKSRVDKTWRPLELLISIQPQESFSPDRTSYASISLFVKCSREYPTVKPSVIELRHPVGLPQMAISQLQSDIQAVMDRCQGEVVIFTLIDFIREFLSPFNHAQVERRPTVPTVLSSSDNEKKNRSTVDLTHQPNINLWSSHSQYSRFCQEFEAVEKLGEGGFGEVFKARNKLDQRFYAVKKIALNVSVKQQQKLFREVNLLSTLNHDYIVRYFSTWIESETESDSSLTTASDGTASPPTPVKEASIFTKSVSLAFRKESISSDFIEFESNDESEEVSEDDVHGRRDNKARKEKTKSESPSSSKSIEGPSVLRFMFIQMELCEKHTLKDAIDSKSLLGETKRVMRLFREIVEGLSYLHESGIIHRDLKPVNIFLDAKDHAKIGDFGLATTDVNMREEVSSSGKVGTFYYTAPELDLEGKSNRLKFHSQKMDMYSLGVILFEMLYRPMTTGMERHTILTNLRKSPTEFPSDFCNYSSNADNESLIRRLLNPDPTLRPSSSRLQESLPPLDLEHRDKQRLIKQLTSNKSDLKDFKEVVNEIFKNGMDDNVKVFYGYERTLDEGVLHGTSSCPSCHPRNRKRVSSSLRFIITEVMKRFGAEYFSPSTFTPKSCEDDMLDKVVLLDCKGGLVYPTFSSRHSFARYVATHHVCNMRRFSIDKVYRKKTTPNPILLSTEHPKELYEVAYDMVFPIEGPDPQVLPEATLLSLLLELQSELSFLSSKNIVSTLVISHGRLLKGALKFCGVKDDKFKRIVQLLVEGSSYPRAYLEKKLVSEGIITDNSKMMVLSAALDVSKETLTAFKDSLKTILRKKQTLEQKEGLEMVLSTVNELRFICKTLDSLGHSFKYNFRTFLYSCLETYSGFCFQLDITVLSDSGSSSKKKACRGKSAILAVGGRYDNLINTFAERIPMNESNNNNQSNSSSLCFNPGAVGLSIEFEKLVCLALEDEVTSKSSTKFTTTDITIVSFPISPNDKEKCQNLFNETLALGRSLRQNGYRVTECCDVHTFDNLHQKCRDKHIRAAIVLREDLENKTDVTARLLVYERQQDKPLEKKVVSYSHREVLDIVKQNLGSKIDEGVATRMTISNSDSSYVSISSKSQDKLYWQSSREASGDNIQSNSSHSNSLSGLQSVTSTVSGTASMSSAMDIQFYPFEGKIPTHIRKRHETVISSLLTNAFNVSSGFIHVLAVELPFKVVKAIVNEVDLDDDVVKQRKMLDSALHCLQEKYPRFRRYLPCILEDIFDLKSVKRVSSVTLFSYTDCKFVTFT